MAEKMKPGEIDHVQTTAASANNQLNQLHERLGKAIVATGTLNEELSEIPTPDHSVNSGCNFLWNDIAAGLAADPSAEGWQFVSSLYERVAHLPTRSFQASASPNKFFSGCRIDLL